MTTYRGYDIEDTGTGYKVYLCGEFEGFFYSLDAAQDFIDAQRKAALTA